MNEITFRRANIRNDEEMEFIAKIDNLTPALFDSDFVPDDKMTADRVKYFKSLTEADFFEVAVDSDDDIIGFHVVKKIPHFDRFAGRIDTLWVAEKLRRSGIAKALKIRSEQWAKNSGLDHIHTWVHVDNAKMISMNKIMGYKTTILKMRKDLTSMTKEFTSEVIKKEIPTLQLPRLTLRPFTVADAKDVQRQAGNIKVSSMTASIPHPYPDGVAEIWISKHQGRYNEGKCVDWAIQLNENKKLIGNISLILNKAHHRAEIGYWIGEEYWNKGYCSEAARAAINFAFKELGLTKVIGRHVAENTASGKVMINAGMKQEGYFAKDFFKDGQFLDMILYGVIQN